MTRFIAALGMVLLCLQPALGQKDNIIRNAQVIPMTYHGQTVALRDYVEDKNAVNEITKTEKLGYHPKDDWYLNPTVNPNALPQGLDPALQKEYPTGQAKALVQNFDGMGYTGVNPADPSVDVGPNYVIQMINGNSGSLFEVYDKAGNVIQAATFFDNFFGYPGGAGDPIVLYDELAGRWLMSEFSSSGNNMYVAISSTGDPLGTWNTYTFNAPSFPDYPKYSIWNDAYIITTNEATSACYALDRTNMLAGNPATAQRFDIPNFGTIGFQAATPVSLNGTTLPPAGTPAMVMRMRDDAWTGATSDALEMWEFDIDWVTPANTTLTQSQVLTMGAPFDSELCGYTSFACIPQPGTGTTLDPLREVLMNRIHYRNFGSHESIVCCHVTDVDGTDWAGVRWYELRRTGGTSGSWTIYQEGTYAPDTDNRWMASIGISATGNIGLMFNVSSSSTFPSLRYTGRKECDPLGVMTEPETTIIAGSGSNASNRYGDYNQMGYDPVDGETFWCTGKYNASAQWSTRIAAFNIDPCDPTVQFDQPSYTVDEPDADQENGCRDYQILNVPISIGVGPSQPADITINVTGGSATQGEDYDISNTTFQLTGSNLTDSAVIWIYDDQYVEGPETITLDYTLNANGGNATAGTINQTVTITINDDDLDPASMTNTITVLTEDFESGALAPWTTVNPSGDTPWQVGDEATAETGPFNIPSTNPTLFAWINDDACDCDQNDVDLISPSFDLTGYSSASLNFDSYFEGNTWSGNTEVAEVHISVGGGPFNFLATVQTSPIDVDWTNQTVDLTPFVGNANVQIAFNYSDGTGWLYGCTIDNVLITGEEPIGIQTAVNTTVGDTAWLGPNGTVHFYDPATSDVMATIQNTSTFDYGCVVVEVDRPGTTPSAEEFNSTATPDYLHSKTFRIRPDNNNPTGSFDATLYYEEAEVAAWEAFTGNSRVDAEVIKVAGNNQISDVTPANYTTFTIDNIPATIAAFNSDVTFTAPFTTGFSGFGVGIYNTTTTTVTHTVVLTNPTCNGASDGQIEITAAGGTSPYQYSIDGGTTWQSGNIFSGLPAGSYDVVVEDNGGTQSAISIEVLTDPAPVTYTPTITDETCGSADGEILLVGAGGDGTYQYSIDGGTTFQASGTFSGLTAGTYNIVVEDGNGCQTTGTETVGNIGGPSIDAVNTIDPQCNGGTDGSISITASGGTGTLLYSIDGGTSFQTGTNFNGLTAGTYSIVVEDANGCQSTSSATLTDPPVITYTTTTVDETCSNANGEINISGSGGTGALQYSIDGGTTLQSSGTFTGLTAGTYNIVVQDANGCQATGTETINDLAGPTIDAVTATDPTCNGDTDGQIDITVTGGTGTINYSIDGGSTFQTGSTFTGLAGGTFNIVVEDANGCQATSSTTLNDPAAVTYTATTVDETCGNSDGEINITGSGGTGTLQYSIDGGTTFQASGSFTGIGAGTYNVVVEDANGCQATGTETVNSIGGPSIDNITTTDPACNGDADGEIVITSSGGQNPIRYSIDGGTTLQVSNTFSGLTAGTYTAAVQDGNGCLVTQVVTLTDPAAITYTASNTDESCGNADGIIDLTGSGGTGALQYSIDGGTTFQASGTFSSLTAGTYNIVIEDANGCQTTGTETLSGTAAVSFTSTTTDASCGNSDGEIVITASGGTGSFQYSIDGGTTFQGSNTFSGLPAATYNIVVDDANGCSATGTESISNSGAPTIDNLSGTDVSCNGASDGNIAIIASGGTGALQYSIDGGTTFQGTGLFTGLSGGSYSIVVEDGVGCQATSSITISEPSAITYTASITDESCGQSDGEIVLSASGGTGSFQYSIDGGTTFQAPGTFSGLTAGTYNIVVEDGTGCQVTGTETVGSAAGPSISSITSTDITCNGANDGTINITASGGTGTILYSIDGGSNFQTSNSFSNLSAGTYNIVVEDANGCQATGSTVITEPTAITHSVTSTDVTCNGQCDGTASLTVSGGTGSYTILWSDGQNGLNAVGLCAGSYTYSGTDANGCSFSGSVVITEPTAISVSVTSTDITCNGANDGTIDITATGGSGTYQYSIDGGTTFQGPATFTGLGGGTYNIVVEDSDGCQETATATVNEPAALTIGTSSTDITCNGVNDGTITITASGGTGTIQYSIDGATTFQTSGNFTGLPQGTYNIVVEDANGCQATGSETIAEPSSLTVTLSGTDPTCNGSCDGQVTSTPSGGTPPYSYVWSSGSTSPILTGACGGTNYILTVTDGNGCSASSSITLTEPAAVNYSAVTNPSNCSGANGSIDITASGGTGTFQYSIDGGTTFQGTGIFTGLTSGTYNIVVEDSDGCQSTGTTTVGTSGSISIASMSSTDPTCNGGSDGTIDIVASGGNPPLQYSVDGGATFQGSGSFTGLPAGTYNILVEGSGGCQGTGTINLSEPTAVSLTSSSTNENCGNSDGSINVSANGGTGTLQYSIDGGATFQSTGSFSGLTAGTYNIVVEDANGCQATGTETVGANAGPSNATATATDVLCNGGNNGSISISSTGGTAPLDYSIDGGTSFQSNSTFNNVSAGTYNVVVQDDNGCTTSTTVTVNEPTAVSFSSTTTDASCNNADGEIDVVASGGTSPYQFSIDGGTNFQGTGTFTGLTAGIYVITVEDDNGCSVTALDTVDATDAPVIDSIVTVDVTCFDSTDASIEVFASAGTPPYTYSFDGGTTFQTASDTSGLPMGTYGIVVEDATGCQVFGTATIEQPAPLSGTIAVNNTTCGMDNGAAVIDVNGGTQPYAYMWSDSSLQTTNGASDLAAGTYTVMVSDANGCMYSDSATIADSDSMSINIEVVHESCTDAADGWIALQVSGGAAPYDILWSTGDTTTSIDALTGGLYSVNITDSLGCTVTEEVPLETDNLDCVIIPTAISPNGDQANDTWIIDGLDIYPDHRVEIYNRWGSLLYSQANYQGDWDGTYNGEPLPAGVYYFVVTLEEDDVRTGSITIMR